MIYSLVLAAGASRRMVSEPGTGLLKQILPFGKSTVIETLIENLIEGGVENPVIVTGYHSERIMEKIKYLPVDIIINHEFEQGMLSSIKTGIFYIIGMYFPEDGGILVSLGDQPGIKPVTVKNIMEEFGNTPDKIIIPSYHNQKGHPIIIPIHFVEEILQVPVEKGLREFMSKHPEDIRTIPQEDPWVIQDMDTLEDYQKALL